MNVTNFRDSISLIILIKIWVDPNVHDLLVNISEIFQVLLKDHNKICLLMERTESYYMR